MTVHAQFHTDEPGEDTRSKTSSFCHLEVTVPSTAIKKKKKATWEHNGDQAKPRSPHLPPSLFSHLII